MRAIVLFAALLGLFGTAPAAAAPEAITIPAADNALQALVYRPRGDGPFPAIVALHGCEGLRGSNGEPRRAMDAWGQRLAEAGFVVVFPDSYRSRGAGQQCNNRVPKIRPERERLSDIQSARDWLQQQTFVRSDRIGLLGWDNGGIAALWAVRPQQEPDDDRPDFRSAAVLYPGCRRLGDTAWSTRIPTLILIGAADNWTPAKHCEDMVRNARGRSAQVLFVAYKGAHHAFDQDQLPLKQRRKIAFAPNPGGYVTVGTNTEARVDALKRIPQWFQR
ncbi:dienelactone hydrolase family protein [Pseudorhodoplanes sp.]|uniref:dienelactone hydrolase family protein n=1 Tax=Pseudorhodoplanes sp. TaxID=1934341 RepID=UPI00391C36AE